MGTDDILLEDNPAMDYHPVQGGVAILLGLLREKLRTFGPLAPGLPYFFSFIFTGFID